MNIKTITSEIKALDDKNMISGYGSIFGNIDSHKDIVMPGAFTKTIVERKDKIKILWQHNMYEPIGRVTSIKEDNRGLFFEARISETDVGKKAIQLIKDGVINELSIGYDTIKEDYDPMKKANLLREIRLYEISAVTFASNSLAQITDVKEMLKDYQYSGGNIFDIIAKQMIEHMKTNLEPAKTTQDDDIEEILALLKKYK